MGEGRIGRRACACAVKRRRISEKRGAGKRFVTKKRISARAPGLYAPPAYAMAKVVEAGRNIALLLLRPCRLLTDASDTDAAVPYAKTAASVLWVLPVLLLIKCAEKYVAAASTVHLSENGTVTARLADYRLRCGTGIDCGCGRAVCKRVCATQTTILLYHAFPCFSTPFFKRLPQSCR